MCIGRQCDRYAGRCVATETALAAPAAALVVEIAIGGHGHRHAAVRASREATLAFPLVAGIAQICVRGDFHARACSRRRCESRARTPSRARRRNRRRIHRRARSLFRNGCWTRENRGRSASRRHGLSRRRAHSPAPERRRMRAQFSGSRDCIPTHCRLELRNPFVGTTTATHRSPVWRNPRAQSHPSPYWLATELAGGGA